MKLHRVKLIIFSFHSKHCFTHLYYYYLPISITSTFSICLLSSASVASVASDLEDSRSISSGLEDAQRNHRSARSSSKHRQSKHRSSSRHSRCSDSDADDTQLPESFITDKENQRFDSNTDIMVTSNTRSAKLQKRKFDQLVEENKEKDEKLAELEEEITLLKAETKMATKKGRNSRNLNREEKEWQGRIWKATKSAIWNQCKFITSDAKLIRATKLVMEKMNLKELANLPEGQKKKDWISTWVAENKDYVRTGMNDVRNYTQGELRKVMVEKMMANQEVPTAEQVFQCATRVDCGTDEKNEEMFDFYVDVLLPKVALKENWDTNIRHYQTVSAAHHLGEPDKKCITVNTEAFLVLVFENCEEKWKYLVKCKRNGTKEDRSHDEYVSPFTDVRAGQQRWGGWNENGRKRHKELCKLIGDARKKGGKEFENIEIDCLTRLRCKHNVEERDQARANRGRAARGMVEESESEDEYDNI